MPLVTSCSVKVMRSFDYCHFEIVLGVTTESNEQQISNADIDLLRKEAARHADKAVEQYKVAKRALAKRESAIQTMSYGFEKAEFQRIEAKAETDRTEEEKATWKHYKDAVFQANRAYDYQDDWDDQDSL